MGVFVLILNLLEILGRTCD